MTSLDCSKHRSWKTWAAGLVVLITPLLVFWGARQCQLLDIDDNVNLYLNSLITRPQLGYFLEFWKGATERLYAPVTYCVWLGARFFDLAFLEHAGRFG